MDKYFRQGFEKSAAPTAIKAIGLKTPSFGKSLRGSAFSIPSKHLKVDIPKFDLAKGNATGGYSSGSTKGIDTTSY